MTATNPPPSAPARLPTKEQTYRPFPQEKADQPLCTVCHKTYSEVFNSHLSLYRRLMYLGGIYWAHLCPRSTCRAAYCTPCAVKSTIGKAIKNQAPSCHLCHDPLLFDTIPRRSQTFDLARITAIAQRLPSFLHYRNSDDSYILLTSLYDQYRGLLNPLPRAKDPHTDPGFMNWLGHTYRELMQARLQPDNLRQSDLALAWQASRDDHIANLPEPCPYYPSKDGEHSALDPRLDYDRVCADPQLRHATVLEGRLALTRHPQAGPVLRALTALVKRLYKHLSAEEVCPEENVASLAQLLLDNAGWLSCTPDEVSAPHAGEVCPERDDANLAQFSPHNAQWLSCMLDQVSAHHAVTARLMYVYYQTQMVGPLAIADDGEVAPAIPHVTVAGVVSMLKMLERAVPRLHLFDLAYLHKPMQDAYKRYGGENGEQQNSDFEASGGLQMMSHFGGAGLPRLPQLGSVGANGAQPGWMWQTVEPTLWGHWGTTIAEIIDPLPLGPRDDIDLAILEEPAFSPVDPAEAAPIAHAPQGRPPVALPRQRARNARGPGLDSASMVSTASTSDESEEERSQPRVAGGGVCATSREVFGRWR